MGPILIFDQFVHPGELDKGPNVFGQVLYKFFQNQLERKLQNNVKLNIVLK